MAQFTLNANVKLNSPSSSNINQVLNQIQGKLGSINVNIRVNNDALQQTSKIARVASDDIEKFGKQAAIAVRRYGAFTLATTSFLKFINALSSGVSEAIKFDREVIKLIQVTGQSAEGVKVITNEVTRLSKQFGVASTEILDTSVTLAQAGLSAKETKIALEALTKTGVAATFGNIKNTTEAAIAIMQQFGKSASDLDDVLSSVNKVAAAFAVESEDITVAVQRSGAAFQAAGGNLNEFIALFTSVRQTTRESAETIATGFRTIFTRIQRPRTLEFLKEIGIELRNLEGQFVGPYEAIRRISQAVNNIPSTDPRFAQIVEELGGFRQVSKVIPLIQQFDVAQKALNVSLRSSGSLSDDAAIAQDALSIKVSKVKEEFAALIRTIANDKVFRGILDVTLNMTSAFIRLAETITPLMPLIATFAAVQIGKAGGQFFKGFGKGIKGYNTGGLVPGNGNQDSVLAGLTPGEFVLNKKSVQSIGVPALQRLTKYASGGKVDKLKSIWGDDNTRNEWELLLSGASDQSVDKVYNQLGYGKKIVPNKITLEQAKSKLYELNTKTAQNKIDAVTRSENTGGIGILDVPSNGSSIAIINASNVNDANAVSTQTSITNKKTNKTQTIRGNTKFISTRSDYGNFEKAVGGQIEGFADTLIGGVLPGKGQTGTKNTDLLEDSAVKAIAGYMFEATIRRLTGIKASGATQYLDFNNIQNQGVFDSLFKEPPSKYSPYIEAKLAFGVDVGSLRRHAVRKAYNHDKQIGLKPRESKQKTLNFDEFATGGMKNNISPSLVMPGEFIFTKQQAQNIGYDKLHALNKTKRYARGGVVEPPVSPYNFPFIEGKEGYSYKTGIDIGSPDSPYYTIFSNKKGKRFKTRADAVKFGDTQVELNKQYTQYLKTIYPSAKTNVKFTGDAPQQLKSYLTRGYNKYVPEHVRNALGNAGTKISFTELSDTIYGSYNDAKKQINVNPKANIDDANKIPILFNSMLHEIGHANDSMSGNAISGNAKFREIYNKEASLVDRTKTRGLDYFLPGVVPERRIVNGKLYTHDVYREMAAETFALAHTPHLSNRGITLSEKFPETLGYARELFNAQKSGSLVPNVGSKPNQDSVLASLSPGEFVLNSQATKQIGIPALKQLNRKIPKFASGGMYGGNAAYGAKPYGEQQVSEEKSKIDPYAITGLLTAFGSLATTLGGTDSKLTKFVGAMTEVTLKFALMKTTLTETSSAFAKFATNKFGEGSRTSRFAKALNSAAESKTGTGLLIAGTAAGAYFNQRSQEQLKSAAAGDLASVDKSARSNALSSAVQTAGTVGAISIPAGIAMGATYGTAAGGPIGTVAGGLIGGGIALASGAAAGGLSYAYDDSAAKAYRNYNLGESSSTLARNAQYFNNKTIDLNTFGSFARNTVSSSYNEYSKAKTTGDKQDITGIFSQNISVLDTYFSKLASQTKSFEELEKGSGDLLRKFAVLSKIPYQEIKKQLEAQISASQGIKETSKFYFNATQAIRDFQIAINTVTIQMEEMDNAFANTASLFSGEIKAGSVNTKDKLSAYNSGLLPYDSIAPLVNGTIGRFGKNGKELSEQYQQAGIAQKELPNILRNLSALGGDSNASMESQFENALINAGITNSSVRQELGVGLKDAMGEDISPQKLVSAVSEDPFGVAERVGKPLDNMRKIVTEFADAFKTQGDKISSAFDVLYQVGQKDADLSREQIDIRTEGLLAKGFKGKSVEASRFKASFDFDRNSGLIGNQLRSSQQRVSAIQDKLRETVNVDERTQLSNELLVQKNTISNTTKALLDMSKSTILVTEAQRKLADAEQFRQSELNLAEALVRGDNDTLLKINSGRANSKAIASGELNIKQLSEEQRGYVLDYLKSAGNSTVIGQNGQTAEDIMNKIFKQVGIANPEGLLDSSKNTGVQTAGKELDRVNAERIAALEELRKANADIHKTIVDEIPKNNQEFLKGLREVLLGREEGRINQQIGDVDTQINKNFKQQNILNDHINGITGKLDKLGVAGNAPQIASGLEEYGQKKSKIDSLLKIDPQKYKNEDFFLNQFPELKVELDKQPKTRVVASKQEWGNEYKFTTEERPLSNRIGDAIKSYTNSMSPELDKIYKTKIEPYYNGTKGLPTSILNNPIKASEQLRNESNILGGKSKSQLLQEAEDLRKRRESLNQSKKDLQVSLDSKSTDRLQAFADSIPRTIEMNNSHKVEVIFNGADVFKGLSEQIGEMAATIAEKKIKELIAQNV